MTDATTTEPRKPGWQGAGPGRPSDYNPKIAARICERVARGETIRKICELKGMPSRPTLFTWLMEREDFARAYRAAKDCVAEDMFDEALEICDATAKPFKNPPKGKSLVDPAVSAKLRIDTRFRMAAKLAPRKYGDKVDPPLLPQATPPDSNGDDAIPVDANNIPLDHHPLYGPMVEWGKVAKGAK